MLNFFNNIKKKDEEDDDVKEYYIPPNQSAQEKEDWAPYVWGVVVVCAVIAICIFIYYVKKEQINTYFGYGKSDVNGQAVSGHDQVHAPGHVHPAPVHPAPGPVHGHG